MTRSVVFLFITALLCLVGCRKPNPQAYLQDPIYKDLDSSQKAIISQITSEEATLAEAKANMEKAAPQTGQIKFAKKHYYDSLARLEKLKQQKIYYDVRIKSRESEALREYLDYYNQKKEAEWPPKEAFDEYKAREEARAQQKVWSVKKRIEEEKQKDAGPKKPAAGGH